MAFQPGPPSYDQSNQWQQQQQQQQQQEQPPHAQKESRFAAFGSKANLFAQKVGKPFNKLSNKLGAEAFFPTALDGEVDKAARILRSFCIDGFEAKDDQHGHHDKQKKQLNHIPAEVMRNARGVAIFTVMRWGLHWSGAGGSGVIVSKLPNGNWSPASGILVHTLGWGLVAGVDIYDCVAVINNEKGMEAFTRFRCSVGGEVSAAAGPLGGGRQLDASVAKSEHPVWTYTKSKGLYVGVQLDGTIIAERDRENERFYGVKGVRHAQILSGQVQAPQGSMVQLWETLQAAEGNAHDTRNLPDPSHGVPGDYAVQEPSKEALHQYEQQADPKDRFDKPDSQTVGKS